MRGVCEFQEQAVIQRGGEGGGEERRERLCSHGTEGRGWGGGGTVGERQLVRGEMEEEKGREGNWKVDEERGKGEREA